MKSSQSSWSWFVKGLISLIFKCIKKSRERDKQRQRRRQRQRQTDRETDRQRDGERDKEISSLNVPIWSDSKVRLTIAS